jgi:uncharacterized membrane protein
MVMASLSSAKTLGGVGGILAIIPAISVVGWVLILVSLKEISDIAQDKSIFDNALIGGITAIISAVAVVVFLASGAFLGFIESALGLSSSFGPGGLLGAAATLGVFDVFAVISAVFLKRAYDEATVRLKIGAFATAGLLYLVGALAAIVEVAFFIFFIGFGLIFFIGVVLIFFVAFIYQIIAYFAIQVPPPLIAYYGVPPPQPMAIPQPQPAQPQVTPPQPMPAISPQTVQPQTGPVQPSIPEFKFCFNCGTKLPYNAAYCSGCGLRQ